MPNPFVDDVETGGRRTGASDYFSGTTPQRSGRSPQKQTTPFTVSQVRQARQSAGPTTARLRRVSTSILAAGGRDDSSDVRFGATGRDAGHAPPKTTAQMRKFVREIPVDDADILHNSGVTLRKEDYGTPGSTDYRKNMLMATASLPEKFGVAKHKIVAGGEEGDQAKSAHVQQVLVGIIHRVKEGKKRSQQMDFMDICTLSGLGGNVNSDDPRDWWDGTEISIWDDWDVCTEEQVRRWQYSVNKYFSDEDRVASNWLEQFVYNSSTDSLRSSVAKKYDRLLPNQQGGVSYLFFTLNEMFQMSREVVDAMKKFLEIFKRNGVSRYTGENVLTVEAEISGVCKRLDAVGALTFDHVLEVLTGLAICTNKRFRDTFDLLKKHAELTNNLKLLETVPQDATPWEQIEAVLARAVDLYDKLSVAGIWNRTSKGGPSAFNNIVQAVDACWNCGATDHKSRECPKPRNRALWKKNYEAFKQAKRSGGQNNNNGGGSDGNKTGDYNRKKWDDNHTNMSMVQGKLMVNCKQCGLNTTHSTKLHKAFVSQGAAWKLRSDHPYAVECAKIGQYNPAVQAVPPPAPNPEQPPPNTPSTGSSMVSIDRIKFEKSLSDFERTSTDPNASQMSEMFRSLFLN
jgi:hypothetical protein